MPRYIDLDIVPKSKPVAWVGSSRADLREFPEGARELAGHELRRVQLGELPSDWKPMATVGPGALEIRIRTAGGQYRVLLVDKFAEAVYVLHAFEKRSRKTSRADLDLGRQRYTEANRWRASR